MDDARDIRQIVHCFSEATLLADGRGRVLVANASAEELWSRPRGLAGASLADLLWIPSYTMNSFLSHCLSLSRCAPFPCRVKTDRPKPTASEEIRIIEVCSMSHVPETHPPHAPLSPPSSASEMSSDATIFIRFPKASTHVSQGAGDSATLEEFRLVLWAKDCQLEESQIALERERLKWEQSRESQPDFLAMMSHELRTPLHGILANADLLLMPDSVLTEDHRSHIRQIRTSGEQLLDQITILLDLAALSSGQFTLNLAPVSLKDCVLSTMRKYENQIQAKRLDFRVRHDHKYCIAMGDPFRCGQALEQLVANAVKYTPIGGRIEIRTKVVGDCVRVEVEDNGVGIAREQQLQIFRDFKQVDRRLENGRAGAGVGLSLAKRLLSLQGGRLGVVSELGKGSVFWFELPRDRQMEDSSADTSASVDMGVYSVSGSANKVAKPLLGGFGTFGVGVDPLQKTESESTSPGSPDVGIEGRTVPPTDQLGRSG